MRAEGVVLVSSGDDRHMDEGHGCGSIVVTRGQ